MFARMAESLSELCVVYMGDDIATTQKTPGSEGFDPGVAFS